MRAVLSANELNELFEVQLGADEVPAAKPAPDGLLMCAKTMGVDPTKVEPVRGLLHQPPCDFNSFLWVAFSGIEVFRVSRVPIINRHNIKQHVSVSRWTRSLLNP